MNHPTEADQIQDYIAALTQEWESRGKWVYPDQVDCLDFIVTEISEAIEERLRLKSYVRNNERPQAGLEAIDKEVGDVLFMAFMWFIIRGESAAGVLLQKMQEMDDKRRG